MKNDYYLLENALEVVRKKALRRQRELEAPAPEVPPDEGGAAQAASSPAPAA
jgi:hypothetical protein